jgi:hypothetical protein
VPPSIDGLIDMSARNGPTAISAWANSIVPTTTPVRLTATTAAQTLRRRAHGRCQVRFTASRARKIFSFMVAGSPAPVRWSSNSDDGQLRPAPPSENTSRMIWSSSGPGSAPFSRLDVVTQNEPSGAATSPRSRPYSPASTDLG